MVCQSWILKRFQVRRALRAAVRTSTVPPVRLKHLSPAKSSWQKQQRWLPLHPAIFNCVNHWLLIDICIYLPMINSTAC